MNIVHNPESVPFIPHHLLPFGHPVSAESVYSAARPAARGFAGILSFLDLQAVDSSS